ncbi:MAG: HypC/HybG/HupF family hydrogenase formation chaperone [Candidatus Limnocylindrales bacterium]
MCLGIPGLIVELPEERPEFARVDVQGVVRDIHMGLLVDDPPGVGDWIVIHLGFALERMTEAEAMDAIGFFKGEESIRPREEAFG